MLKVEFLYYDKTACKRCASTDKSVKRTLKELKNVMENSKVKIDFKEKRLPKSKIRLSPTVLIDGEDVEKTLNKGSALKSNLCQDCCKLVGKQINCRTVVYKGKKYDHIPKQMIRDALEIHMRKGIKARKPIQ